MATHQQPPNPGVIRKPHGILPESPASAARTHLRSAGTRPAAARHFLAIPDFSREELDALFDLAERMREGKYTRTPLAAKTLAMIFMKSSTRTRVSFEVGTFQLGGHALFLSPRDVQLGRGEPIADTARVLSRYVDGIMIRTFAHADAEELARYATVPVINGLTDLLHPCQVLADVLTIRQQLGTYERKKVAWIGDGNNMANSWINAAYRLGFDLTLACPEGYDPDRAILERAQKHGNVRVVRDPREAIDGAHVVNTDVWASMGQEEEQQERERAFAGFTVDADLMRRANRSAIFLHCLPAHRGEEVTADVIDGPQSRVWDEAENRLHVQKAIMAVLMGGEST
ncbi:MAG: ornithine carbamoyltransferase [Gemmatimonadota bacterium]|nr:ornithine carbamoyltransferase [Gemmatimonadota bacterium]